MSTVQVFTLAAPPGAEALDEQNPWPGLESFREEDSAFFRGRGVETEALLRHVRRERVTVLFGLSGLGKSSLLQAGLFPAVRPEQFMPVYVRLEYRPDAPPLRRQVLDALAAAASAGGIEAAPAHPEETLWEHFHRQAHAYWDDENRLVTPLLVFDQFEEAFTLGRSAGLSGGTAEFLDELGDLMEGRPSQALLDRFNAGDEDPKGFAFNQHPYKILLTLREDFLAELDTLAKGHAPEKSIPSLAINRMRLRPLDGEAALLVTQVAGPERIPPAVGERLVRLVADEHGQGTPLRDLAIDPALLSLFCRELNERRRALGRASIGMDLVEGSRGEILSEYYERCLQDLQPEVRHFVEDQLLTVSGHRSSEALEDALELPGVSEEALEKLIRRRLLRREERQGHTRVELTHDVLTGIVRESRDRRRETEREAKRQAAIQAENERLRAQARAARAWFRKAAVFTVFVLVAGGAAGWSAVSAEQLRRDAVRQRIRSDSLAALAQAATRSLRGANQLLSRERDNLAAANALLDTQRAALQSTVQALTAAQDSVRLQQLKALVGEEAADHYLRLSGRIITQRIAQDSALAVTVARADSIRERANQRIDSLAAAVEATLCANKGREPSRGAAAGAPADTALVAQLHRELAQRGLAHLTLCGAPAAGASRP